MSKIILVSMGASDTPEGRGRIAHLLTTAADLADAGADFEVHFHGIGVTWLNAFAERGDKFTQHYGERFDKVRGHIKLACDFCASVRFKAAGGAEQLGVPLVGDGKHTSYAAELVAGARVVSF